LYVGADFDDSLTTPFHCPRLAEFPPTLVLTGELDTLCSEMNELGPS
jgi:acetyl esterase/lipase